MSGILAINGSPHKEGNTVKLIREVVRGSGAADYQHVDLVDLDLRYCNWCGHCIEDTPGVCPIDDGFQDHLVQLFDADTWIVATPSINRSVTGYMKNWLDRLCTSQLDYRVDVQRHVTMQSRVPAGKRAVVIVQGCTNLFQETVEPINVVLKVLGVEIVERVVLPYIGLTDQDTVDQNPEALRQAFDAGRQLRRA